MKTMKMKICNFYHFLLIVATILAMSLAEEASREDELNSFMQKFHEAEELVCAKEISDDQLAELDSKCKHEKDAEVDPIIKECLKVETVTAREKISAICSKENKECLMKSWSEKLAEVKQEEITERVKTFEEKMDLYFILSKLIIHWITLIICFAYYYGLERSTARLVKKFNKMAKRVNHKILEENKRKCARFNPLIELLPED